MDDYFEIAAQVSGVAPPALRRVARAELAESALAAPFAGYGGHECYPGILAKAAVLCARLGRNHALPDYNKRVAYVAMVVFLELNGHRWRTPTPAGDADAVIRRAVAGAMSEQDLAAWIGRHAEPV